MAGHDIDESDIYLLYHKPHTLVEKHQETIEIIVNKYIRSGLFSIHERDDIIQTINVQLLDTKIQKVQQHFDNSTKVVTYLSRVIQNLCLEIHRKNSRRPTIDENQELDSLESETSDREYLSEMFIRSELHRLHATFLLYHTKQAKLELCLKLYYRLPLNRDDILTLGENVDAAVADAFVKELRDHYEDLDDKEVYEKVTPYFNVIENKQNTPDALRKWTNGKIKEIIHLLNAPPANAKYDKETLQILLTKYYENEQKTN